MSNDREGLLWKTTYMEIRVFENFQEELFEAGHVIVTTKVVEKSPETFGNAHGDICLRFVTRLQGSWPFQQVTMR